MTQLDPYKVMRNPATLEAFRNHQKAMRAAAQPWLTIGFAALAVQIGLVLFAVFHSDFRDLSLAFSGMMLVFGLSFAIGGLRARRFSRAHPLELPEPARSAWR